METANVTFITMIHLLGLQVPQNFSFLVFFILLLISGASICGNLLIITVVSYSKTLHTPMYFFLSQLSVLDISMVIDILPSMFYTILAKEATIPFSACITQFYFFAVSGVSECLILTVMSYDRYLAICKPMHYSLIMSNRVCWVMVITIWTVVILAELINIFNVLQLQYCGPNIIDHFFCDLPPILELSCTDTSMVQLVVNMFGFIAVIIPFLIINASYIYILVTIFEIPSITGRKKAFSTCSSHLTVVSIYYGTIVGVYMVPRRGHLRHIAKFLSLLYTTVIPLINPTIYSLRNKDLKNIVGRLLTNF